MNTIDFLELLRAPSQLQNEQIFDLEDVVTNYPFFQAARVLYLKGLKNQSSFRYNQNLKTTAIYTSDRSVLFHFITSDAFQSVLSNQQEKDIIEEIEVRDEKIIENIYQNKDEEGFQEPTLDLDLSIPIHKVIEQDDQLVDTAVSKESLVDEKESNHVESYLIETANSNDIEKDNDQDPDNIQPTEHELAATTSTSQFTNENQPENDAISDLKILDSAQDEHKSTAVEILKDTQNDTQSEEEKKALIEKEINDFFESKKFSSEKENSLVVENQEVIQPISDVLDTNTDLADQISETDNRIDSVDKLEIDKIAIEDVIEKDKYEDPSGFSTKNYAPDDLIDKKEEPVKRKPAKELSLEPENHTDEEFEKLFAKNITKDIFDTTTDKIEIPAYTFEKPKKEEISQTSVTEKESIFNFEIDTQDAISNVEEKNYTIQEHDYDRISKEPLYFELAQNDAFKNKSKERLDTEDHFTANVSDKLEKKVNIDLDLEIEKPIHFNKNEKHSFGEWMQLSSFKPIDRSQQSANKKAKNRALIDEFMVKNPKIKPNKSTSFSVDFNHIEKIEPETVMTETLASIYITQKKYEDAINAYEILSLKFPEKSSFFALQIKMLREKQKNASN